MLMIFAHCRLPQVLNIFEASGLLPSHSAKSREALEWISIELQKTRAVQKIRLRPNLFLNTFSMNDSFDGNTSGCDISFHLVNGADGEMTIQSDGVKTPNIIGSKSNLALKRDPIVKVSFNRFVKLIESLSINLSFQKAIVAKEKKTQSCQKGRTEISVASVVTESSKYPLKNSEISSDALNSERNYSDVCVAPVDADINSADHNEDRNLFKDVDDDIKRDLNVEETIELQNKLVQVLLETHPDIHPEQKTQLLDLLERKRHDADRSKITEYKDILNEDNEMERVPMDISSPQQSDTNVVGGTFLNFMAKKIKAIVSTVTLEQIYHRSNTLSFANPEVQKTLMSHSMASTDFKQPSIAENSDVIPFISEISSGVVIIRGGYLDDPEVYLYYNGYNTYHICILYLFMFFNCSRSC